MTSTDTNCLNAIALAESFSDYNSANTYSNFEDWSSAITQAVINCPDTELFHPEMINIYLMDNPDSANSGDTSFNGSKGVNVDGLEVCHAINFIDIDRLPADPLSPLVFEDAASEHEMGHGFGLGHIYEEIYSGNASNIMQTKGSNICCECAMDGSDVRDTGGYWATDLCVDCSNTSFPATDCDDNPTQWDDCSDCKTTLSIGNRNLGFTDSLDGEEVAGSDGQLEVLHSVAQQRCACQCNLDQEGSRYPVKRTVIANELPCHGGSGRFALMMYEIQDSNSDGVASARLTPILQSGNHLGRLSWIQDITVVSWGDVTGLHLPTSDNPFEFDAQDPDELDPTNMETFDTLNQAYTFTMGHLATAYPWVIDGFDVTSTSFSWPVVDLVWGCNGDYNASDVSTQYRPGNVYRLHTDMLAGDWDQEILLRPDLEAMLMWIELRGQPYVAVTVPLVVVNNNKYVYDFDELGLALSGWIQPVGQPVGEKLRVYIEEGQYMNMSFDDTTLPDLVQLP